MSTASSTILQPAPTQGQAAQLHKAGQNPPKRYLPPEAKRPADVRAAVVADLRDGLKLSRFVPHAPIADSELKGREELSFDIQQDPLLFRVAITSPTRRPSVPSPTPPTASTGSWS